MIPFDPSTDPADRRWRAHLAALPECEPPEALWLRLRDAQQQTRAPQRVRWPWLASAAALALAVLLGSLLRPVSERPAPDATLAAQQIQAPESVTTTAGTDPASRASLLRIDAELTRAYERNADDAELDALWQARKGMLDSLASNASAQLVQL